MFRTRTMRLALWGIFLLGLTGNAYSAEDCRSSFLVTGTPETRLIYAASQTVPHLNTAEAMATLRMAVENEGLTIVSAKQEATQAITEFAPKDDGNTLQYLARVVADESNNTLTMIMALPTGRSADSGDMNNKLCSMLTTLGSADKSKASENPTRDEPSSNTTTTAASTSDALSLATDRTAPPPEIKNILKPSAVFDATAAKAALEPGTAAIAGTACTSRGGLQLARNQKILLFPDTPYLREFIKLVRKAKPGRDRVDADPEFLTARMEGMTNSKGEFQFAKMKSGSYYLYTTISTDVSGVQTVDRGVDASGPAIVHYYSDEPFTNHYDDKLEKFITIKDKKSVKVTLSPSYGRAGYPGIFGCR